MKNSIKLYFHYISIVIRSTMQYKMSFLLTSLGQFLISFNILLGVYFMFTRFESVKEYTYSEVLLCFAIFLMEFSIAECFAKGFDAFPNIVRSGEFDRILVRPRSTILQLLGSRFELSRIGRMLQAIVMFIYGIYSSNITWDWTKILTIVFMLVGGTMLFVGIFMVYASLCFFTLDGLEFMNVFTDGAREYGKYPIDVYGKGILKICTYVVPYTLVQYYPLQYLLGRTESWYYIVCPLGTIFFLMVCYGVWRFGMKHYQSAGA